MPTSKIEVDALCMIYYFSVDVTSRSNSDCGVTTGIIVLSDFGGAMSSFGGDGISILGTSRVKGFAQPARRTNESAISNLISLPPFSMACQAT